MYLKEQFVQNINKQFIPRNIRNKNTEKKWDNVLIY